MLRIGQDGVKGTRDVFHVQEVKSKIYAGWATLAVVMWSWGRATGGANANKGVSTAPLRPSQTTWYHSTIHFVHSYDDKPYSQRAAAKDGGEVEMYSPLTR